MNPKIVVFPEGSGAVERIRTFDRLVNSQPLYRAEPRRHNISLIHFEFHEYYLRLAWTKRQGKVQAEFGD